MFSKNCSNGTIYSHKTWVCVYPDDAICQTLRPWERCNVTENRMKELQKMCSKIPPISININTIDSTSNSNNTGNSTTNSNNTVNSTTTSEITGNSATNSIIIGNRTTTSTITGNSITTSIITGNGDQNTNGIIVPITILLTVFGVLVPVILIGLVIHRYRYKRPSCGVGINPLAPERNHESHPSDPYNSLYSFATSIPEYFPYPTQQFNPTFDVDLGSSGSSSYIIVEEFDSTPSPSTMPGASDDDREYIARGFRSDNRPEIEIVSNEDRFNSITEQSDTTPHPLSMPQPCEADRPVPNLNSQEDQIGSSGGSSYESLRGSDTTAMPQPSHADQEFANKTVSSEDNADIPVPNRNSQEDEIASSGGSSYESLRGSDSTAMPQQSDTDEEFANTTVSSEDREYVVVQQSDPLLHPYISGNGPWPHKVIFSTKDHFLPPCTTFETA